MSRSEVQEKCQKSLVVPMMKLKSLIKNVISVFESFIQYKMLSLSSRIAVLPFLEPVFFPFIKQVSFGTS